MYFLIPHMNVLEIHRRILAQKEFLSFSVFFLIKGRSHSPSNIPKLLFLVPTQPSFRRKEKKNLLSSHLKLRVNLFFSCLIETYLTVFYLRNISHHIFSGDHLGGKGDFFPTAFVKTDTYLFACPVHVLMPQL